MTVKTYRAMVWTTENNAAGRRETVHADSLEEARRSLERQFGAGNIFDLHQEADAASARSTHDLEQQP